MNGDRVAIITGSSRGIGAATARLLANDGYRICVNYRSDETAANAVVSGLASSSTTAIAVQADVGEPDRVDRLADSIPMKRGGTRQVASLMAESSRPGDRLTNDSCLPKADIPKSESGNQRLSS